MGLEEGYIELDGRVLKQPRAMIRPKPSRSFANRFYGSAQSPETFPLFGELGIGLLFIPGAKPWDVVAAELGSYRDVFPQASQSRGAAADRLGLGVRRRGRGPRQGTRSQIHRRLRHDRAQPLQHLRQPSEGREGL